MNHISQTSPGVSPRDGAISHHAFDERILRDPVPGRAGAETPVHVEDEPAVLPFNEPFTERLSENMVASLSYVLGWLSGLLVLFFDRRPFVRYHAAQSVVVFAPLSFALLVLGDFFLTTFVPGAAEAWLVSSRLVELVWIAAAGVLMLKAAAGERFRVPYAAPYAERMTRIST